MLLLLLSSCLGRGGGGRGGGSDLFSSLFLLEVGGQAHDLGGAKGVPDEDVRAALEPLIDLDQVWTQGGWVGM